MQLIENNALHLVMQLAEQYNASSNATYERKYYILLKVNSFRGRKAPLFLRTTSTRYDTDTCIIERCDATLYGAIICDAAIRGVTSKFYTLLVHKNLLCDDIY